MLKPLSDYCARESCPFFLLLLKMTEQRLLLLLCHCDFHVDGFEFNYVVVVSQFLPRPNKCEIITFKPAAAANCLFCVFLLDIIPIVFSDEILTWHDIHSNPGWDLLDFHPMNAKLREIFRHPAGSSWVIWISSKFSLSKIAERSFRFTQLNMKIIRSTSRRKL